MIRHDDDVIRVLTDDGVNKIILDKLENMATTSIDTLVDNIDEKSWAVRLVYNEKFGGVLIQQQPGEGNRLHYHPDADECWVIISGRWEWYIEGEGTKVVNRNDIVVVRRNIKHKINS